MCLTHYKYFTHVILFNSHHNTMKKSTCTHFTGEETEHKEICNLSKESQLVQSEALT